MASPREHLTTWIGLAVGLGLAWAGWEWWCHFRDFVPMHIWNDDDGTVTWYDMPRRPPGEVPLSPDWFETWWAQPAIISGLVTVVLLCTVAGAMVGRRGAVSES